MSVAAEKTKYKVYYHEQSSSILDREEHDACSVDFVHPLEQAVAFAVYPLERREVDGLVPLRYV